MTHKFDYLVIGSGIAGMSFALKVAQAGKKVGIKKGTYISASGAKQGHMWNYYGTKYYDCSSSTGKTPDWKKVEPIKKTASNKKK